MVVTGEVIEGNVCEQAGIIAGDILGSVNVLPIYAMLDYQFLSSADEITIFRPSIAVPAWSMQS